MASGEAESSQEAFLAVPEGGGNNRRVWVSYDAVKWITYPDNPLFETVHDNKYSDRQRLVLHFNDGETAKAFADDTFGLDGKAFRVRLWDQATGKLERALIPHHALKAIFFVDLWDSQPAPPVVPDGAP